MRTLLSFLSLAVILTMVGPATAQPLVTWPMPTGDPSAILADPTATIINDNEVWYEPVNPLGEPTGYNITRIMFRWGPERDWLEVAIETSTEFGDADGDGSPFTTRWPWDPAHPMTCLVEEADDFTGDFWEWFMPRTFYAGYAVVIRLPALVIILGDIADGSTWHQFIANGSPAGRIASAWMNPYPCPGPPFTCRHYVAAHLRELFGTALDGPVTGGYACAKYSHAFWSGPNSADWILIPPQ
jgi:hypothetical protein